MKLKSYARLMLRHLLAAALLGSVMPGFAQLTSSRPVTIVAPFPSGGTPDLAARLLGESIDMARQAELKATVLLNELSAPQASASN